MLFSLTCYFKTFWLTEWTGMSLEVRMNQSWYGRDIQFHSVTNTYYKIKFVHLLWLWTAGQVKGHYLGAVWKRSTNFSSQRKTARLKDIPLLITKETTNNLRPGTQTHTHTHNWCLWLHTVSSLRQITSVQSVAAIVLPHCAVHLPVVRKVSILSLKGWRCSSEELAHTFCMSFSQAAGQSTEPSGRWLYIGQQNISEKWEKAVWWYAKCENVI